MREASLQTQRHHHPPFLCWSYPEHPPPSASTHFQSDTGPINCVAHARTSACFVWKHSLNMLLLLYENTAHHLPRVILEEGPSKTVFADLLILFFILIPVHRLFSIELTTQINITRDNLQKQLFLSYAFLQCVFFCPMYFGPFLFSHLSLSSLQMFIHQ